jgi:hypothetical protein
MDRLYVPEGMETKFEKALALAAEDAGLLKYGLYLPRVKYGRMLKVKGSAAVVSSIIKNRGEEISEGAFSSELDNAGQIFTKRFSTYFSMDLAQLEWIDMERTGLCNMAELYFKITIERLEKSLVINPFTNKREIIDAFEDIRNELALLQRKLQETERYNNRPDLFYLIWIFREAYMILYNMASHAYGMKSILEHYSKEKLPQLKDKLNSIPQISSQYHNDFILQLQLFIGYFQKNYLELFPHIAEWRAKQITIDCEEGEINLITHLRDEFLRLLEAIVHRRKAIEGVKHNPKYPFIEGKPVVFISYQYNISPSENISRSLADCIYNLESWNPLIGKDIEIPDLKIDDPKEMESDYKRKISEIVSLSNGLVAVVQKDRDKTLYVPQESQKFQLFKKPLDWVVYEVNLAKERNLPLKFLIEDGAVFPELEKWKKWGDISFFTSLRDMYAIFRNTIEYFSQRFSEK